MAMIKCTECGKDISDKAKNCPYCGKVFLEEVPVVKVIICSECGTVLSESDKVCHNCGCPVENDINNSKDSRYWKNTYVRKDQIIGKVNE